MLSSRPFFQTLRFASQRAGAAWLHRGAGGVYHRHAELELNLCVAGHAHYLVGERRFHLSRRSMLWLFPAQDHILLEASPDFAMWIAVWKPELIQATCQIESSRELAQMQPAQTWFAQARPNDAARLESLFTRLSQSPNDDYFNAGLGYALMESRRVYAHSEESLAGRAVHPCVDEAARLLRDEMLDVPELAHRVGLSANRLSRLFHAQIGVTITAFRTRMALERFARIYDGRSLSITQAAIEAGFHSYAQFHRVFAAQYGCSPAAYREELRDAK